MKLIKKLISPWSGESSIPELSKDVGEERVHAEKMADGCGPGASRSNAHKYTQNRCPQIVILPHPQMKHI